RGWGSRAGRTSILNTRIHLGSGPAGPGTPERIAFGASLRLIRPGVWNALSRERSNEQDLQPQGVRDRAQLAGDRRGRSASRPSLERGRRPLDGQAQADLRLPPGHRGFRHRAQRPEDAAHGAQGTAEGLLPPQRLPGRHQGRDRRAPAQAPPRAARRARRLGHAAEDQARPPVEDQAQGLRRRGPSAPGAAARALRRRPGDLSQPRRLRVNEVQYYGTGRRKTSTARVFLRPGHGEVKVNDRALDDYFPNEVLKMVIKQPLLLTETAEKFDIYVTVLGGGSAGQAGAIRHGISRALLEYNGELRDRL